MPAVRSFESNAKRDQFPIDKYGLFDISKKDFLDDQEYAIGATLAEPPMFLLWDLEHTLDAKRQSPGVITHIAAFRPVRNHLVEGIGMKAPESIEGKPLWERRYWVKRPDEVLFKYSHLRAIPGQHLFVGNRPVPRREEDDACSQWSEYTYNPHCPGE